MAWYIWSGIILTWTKKLTSPQIWFLIFFLPQFCLNAIVNCCPLIPFIFHRFPSKIWSLINDLPLWLMVQNLCQQFYEKKAWFIVKWYKMLNWADKRMKSFRMSKITIYHCTSKLKAMSYGKSKMHTRTINQEFWDILTALWWHPPNFFFSNTQGHSLQVFQH